MLPFILLMYSDISYSLLAHYSDAALFSLSLLSIAFLFIACEILIARRFSAYAYIEKSLSSYYLFFPVTLYLFGTYIGNGIVQFVSIILTFLLVVAIIAGIGCALIASPALLFLLYPLFAMTGLAFPLSLIFFSFSGLLVYLSSKIKRIEAERCEYCSSYEREGRNFCLYCGRLLNEPPFIFPYRKIVGMLVISLLFLAAFQVNVFVYANSEGSVEVKMINLGTVKNISPFPVSAGFSISAPVIVNDVNGTIYIYNMSYDNVLNQKVYLTFAGDPASGLSNLITFTSARIFYASEPGPANELYAWNESGVRFLGLSTYFPVYLMQGNKISFEYASLLVGEDSITFSQEGGETISNFINRLNTFNSNLLAYSFVLVIYSNLVYWSGIIEAAILVAVMLILAYLARSIDYKKRRIFDNSLALSSSEFNLLVRLRDGKKEKIGQELLQSAASNPSKVSWREILAFLEKLRYLGLVDERIKVISGRAKLVWRFRV